MRCKYSCPHVYVYVDVCVCVIVFQTIDGNMSTIFQFFFSQLFLLIKSWQKMSIELVGGGGLQLEKHVNHWLDCCWWSVEAIVIISVPLFVSIAFGALVPGKKTSNWDVVFLSSHKSWSKMSSALGVWEMTWVAAIDLTSNLKPSNRHTQKAFGMNIKQDNFNNTRQGTSVASIYMAHSPLLTSLPHTLIVDLLTKQEQIQS